MEKAITKFIWAMFRELGRNLGKVLSNAWFKDRHSTPYRRTDRAPKPDRPPDVIELNGKRFRYQGKRKKGEQVTDDALFLGDNLYTRVHEN